MKMSCNIQDVLQRILVFGLIYSVRCQDYHYYNRSLLQDKYPGYGSEFIFFPDPDGQPIKVYLKEPQQVVARMFGIGEYNVEKDTNFTFYSRQIPDGYLVKSPEQAASVFDNNRPTKFITHGWMSSGKADTCISIKDGFLHKYDANIFVLDWSPIAGNLIYPIPMKATAKIGEFYGSFIQTLIDQYNANPRDIHLVGHSLGAHVSGFAGRHLKNKVGRITGLDPALPGFDVGLVDGHRLTSKDADFVDIIHTCAGFLGYKTPIGHADFYPNGGSPPQPGCGILELMEACSHGRSWKLFAESLTLDVPYMAKKCGGFMDLLDKKCHVGVEIPMGDLTPSDARGVYYIKTTNQKPYIKAIFNELVYD